MDRLNKNMVIDGILASEGLDTSGEVLRVKGCDISDLEEGNGILNFEHNSDNPNDILGKITYARKIYGSKDCEDERQLAYWNKIGIPFIYGKAELFDGEGHPGAIAAAAIIRYYHRRGEPLLARYSIEGTTLARDKDGKGNVLERSVARKIALTLKPCNRSCYSGVVFDDFDKSEKTDRQIYKGEFYETDIFLSDSLAKAEEDSELEELEKKLVGPKKVLLEHYSSQGGLKEINPKYHGTGIAGAESKRKRNDPKGWVDRSYYYEAGTKPEASLAGRKKYTVELPEDAKIYDLAEDPDDLIPKSRNPSGIGTDLNLLDRNIKDSGYFGYKHSGSALPNAVAIFHPLKPLRKAISLGGYGGAPSSRTQGSALQREQWADNPEEAKKKRAQVMAAFRDWDRVTPIRKFLKMRLPEASKNYIEHFASLVDDYQVKKAEQLFGNLQKSLKISGTSRFFEELKKNQEADISKYKVYVPELNETTVLVLVNDTLKYKDGVTVPEESVEELFKMAKLGHFKIYPFEDIEKNDDHYVCLGIHDIEEMMDIHSEATRSFISMFATAAETIAAKHQGSMSQNGVNKFCFAFDSIEKAKGFIKDVCNLEHTMESSDHSHELMLDLGMGASYEEAEAKLEGCAEERKLPENADESHIASFEDMEKTSALVTFPNLREKGLHYTVGYRKPKYTEAAVKRLDPTMKNPLPPVKGIVAGRVNPDKPTPGRERSVVASLHSKYGADLGTKRHEEQHSIFQRIGEKYGAKTRMKLAEHLIRSIPKEHSELFNDISSGEVFGVHPNFKNEEKIAFLHSYMNSSKYRSRVHNYWKDKGFDPIKIDKNIKKVARHLVNTSKKLKLEDFTEKNEDFEGAPLFYIDKILNKAYGDSPEDQRDILKRLFGNHMMTKHHLKQMRQEFDTNPTDRAKLKVDRAKASHAHTEHYLGRALNQYHPEEDHDQVLEGLFDEWINEGFDKAEKKLPGEYQFKDLPDLEHHLSNEKLTFISPFSSKRTSQENEQHHNSFLEDLKAGGHTYTPVVGHFGEKEPSYIIHNMDDKQAEELARKYGQLSHIISNKGKHSYKVNEEHGYAPPGGAGHEISDKFDDMYTVANFSSGGSAKFRVNLEPTKKSEKLDIFSLMEVDRNKYDSKGWINPAGAFFKVEGNQSLDSWIYSHPKFDFYKSSEQAREAAELDGWVSVDPKEK